MGYVNPPTARLENISQNGNPNPVNENPFCDEESEAHVFGMLPLDQNVFGTKKDQNVFLISKTCF